MRLSSTTSPSSMNFACASEPAVEDEAFRHRHPFDMPRAGGALEILDHGVEHQAGVLAHRLGVGDEDLRRDRVALLRHGARRAAMAGERLERLAELRHHHQHDVEADLAERAGDEARGS